MIESSDFLDPIHRQMEAGQVRPAMAELTRALREAWSDSTEESRRDLVAACRDHPLFGLTAEDPLTLRARKKPRGYAGDAVMMDMIYYSDARGQLEPSTPLGMEILACMTAITPTSTAVRHRRKYAAELIDEAAERKAEPHVLVVASGHLREAELSEALRSGRIGRFAALDQDELSLQEVKRCYGSMEIEPIKSSIRPFLTRRDNFGTFDLIYSIGLYDYLDEMVALKVTERLFASLNPGGRLMIANFLPETFEVGYMECFMEWTLIYRDLDQIRQTALTVPRDELASQEVFREPTNTIGYMVLTKK